MSEKFNTAHPKHKSKPETKEWHHGFRENCKTIIESKRILRANGTFEHGVLFLGAQHILHTLFFDSTGLSENNGRELHFREIQTELQSSFKHCAFFDFGNRPILPSAINSHTHLAMIFFRGLIPSLAKSQNMIEDVFFKIESKLTYDDVYYFSKLGAYECLLNGTGFVADHYYFADAVAEALYDVGLAGMVGATLQDLHGPGKDSWKQNLKLTQTLSSNKKLSNANVFSSVAPHASDSVSKNLLTEALNLSVSEKIPLHMHLAQSVEEVERIKQQQNKTPFEYLQSLGFLSSQTKCLFAHGIHTYDTDFSSLTKLEKENFQFVFCPKSQLQFQHPAPILLWKKHNIEFSLATDCAASNDTMNVWQELAFVSDWLSSSGSSSSFGLQLGQDRKLWNSNFAQTEFSIFQHVYSVPGEFLKFFGIRVGEICTGALANLVVLSTDTPEAWPMRSPLRQLSHGDMGASLHAHFVQGKLLGTTGNLRSGVLESDSYKETLFGANMQLAKLLERCALK